MAQLLDYTLSRLSSSRSNANRLRISHREINRNYESPLHCNNFGSCFTSGIGAFSNALLVS